MIEAGRTGCRIICVGKMRRGSIVIMRSRRLRRLRHICITVIVVGGHGDRKPKGRSEWNCSRAEGTLGGRNECRVTASADAQQGRMIVVFRFEQSSSLETIPVAAGRYPKSQSRFDRMSLSWKLDTPAK